MHIPFCEWHPRNERNWIWQISDRPDVEAQEPDIWNLSNDYRKPVCHGGSHTLRSAGGNPDLRIHGALLSKEDLQAAESGNGTAGRHPIGCIWVLRPGRTGAMDQGDGTGAWLRRKRKQHPYGISSAWHDDPSDDHRRDRVGNPCGACPVL